MGSKRLVALAAVVTLASLCRCTPDDLEMRLVRLDPIAVGTVAQVQVVDACPEGGRDDDGDLDPSCTDQSVYLDRAEVDDEDVFEVITPSTRTNKVAVRALRSGDAEFEARADNGRRTETLEMRLVAYETTNLQLGGAFTKFGYCKPPFRFAKGITFTLSATRYYRNVIKLTGEGDWPLASDVAEQIGKSLQFRAATRGSGTIHSTIDPSSVAIDVIDIDDVSGLALSHAPTSFIGEQHVVRTEAAIAGGPICGPDEFDRVITAGPPEVCVVSHPTPTGPEAHVRGLSLGTCTFRVQLVRSSLEVSGSFEVLEAPKVQPDAGTDAGSDASLDASDAADAADAADQ